MGDILRDEKEADRLALTIAPGSYHDARADAPAILAYSSYHPLPLAVAECRLHDFARLSGGNIFRSVQNLRVQLADHLLGLVPVHSPGALVPEQNLSVQILTDDGVLRRRFENIADEF